MTIELSSGVQEATQTAWFRDNLPFVDFSTDGGNQRANIDVTKVAAVVFNGTQVWVRLDGGSEIAVCGTYNDVSYIVRTARRAVARRALEELIP